MKGKEKRQEIHLMPEELEKIFHGENSNGIDEFDLKLYLALRKVMDKRTLICGKQKDFPISLGSLSRAMRHEPPRGSHKNEAEPSKKKIRCALERLEESGLVSNCSEGMQLLLKLNFAGKKIREKNDEHPSQDKSVQMRRGTMRGTGKGTKEVIEIKEENSDFEGMKGTDEDSRKGTISNINYKKHNLYISRVDEFLSIYPRLLGSNEIIKIYWEENNFDEIADVIVADVRLRVAKDIKWRQIQFIPGPMKYLEEKRWNNPIEVEGQRPIQIGEKKVAPPISEEEVKRREHLADLQHWERFKDRGMPKRCKDDCKFCAEMKSKVCVESNL